MIQPPTSGDLSTLVHMALVTLAAISDLKDCLDHCNQVVSALIVRPYGNKF